MKPRGTSLKKSKKRRAIALVTLGDLWRPGSALGGYGGALGDPGGASGGSGGALEALGVSIYRENRDFWLKIIISVETKHFLEICCFLKKPSKMVQPAFRAFGQVWGFGGRLTRL